MLSPILVSSYPRVLLCRIAIICSFCFKYDTKIEREKYFKTISWCIIYCMMEDKKNREIKVEKKGNFITRWKIIKRK